MPKTGRNDPCPCGSGRKYKRCCEARQAAKQSRVLIVAVGGAILAAVAVGIASFTSERAPAGQVWSPEHGHYHTVGTGSATPGAGRVWSEEHQHYH